MKDSAYSDIVFRKLNEFEQIQDIHPSPGWKESLLERIASSKPRTSSGVTSVKLVLPVLLILLLNLSFVLNTILNDARKPSMEDEVLKVISQELLINPISIKY
jgi:hypothetical protein